MGINRREFGKMTAGGAAGALALAFGGTSLLTLTGCSVNVKGMISAVLSSAQALLKVAAPNSAWIPQMNTAIAALQLALTNWTSGPVTVEIIEAAQAVSNAVAAIDPNSTIAALAAVLATAISLLIAALPAPVVASMKVKAVHNRYIGKAHLRNSDPHSHKFVSDYRDQWNDTALSANLPAAVI